MENEIYEKRSDRRYSKKKLNKKIISLAIIFTLFISVFAYSKNSSADNNKVTNPSVELNVEKVSRDKVKISLSDFTPVIKSLQLSLEINGNAKFKEDSINWLVTSGSNDLKTHVKMSNDNKKMEIFAVSSDALKKVGGTLDICEIEVSKVSNGSSAYSIDASLNSDGVPYSYVINDTNKQVAGIDMANLSDKKLTINSSPIIALKNSPSVADGKIIISKGDTFDAKTYIEVTDEEDGIISTDNVTVEGKVNTKIVGSYAIKYSVSDSEGDTSYLETTVIVEDVAVDSITNPVITVNNGDSDKLTITAGDKVDLNDYITAVDYLGRAITVEIKGDYDLTVPGTYNITAVATDRFGNVSEKAITLVIEKSDDSNDNTSGDNGNNGDNVDNGNNGDNVDNGNNGDNVDNGNNGDNVDNENNGDNVDNGNNGDNVDNGNNGGNVDNENNGGNVDNGNNGDNVDNENNGGNVDNGSGDNTNNPQVPENSQNTGSSNNSTVNDDKKPEENKNEIPKTGQGVFYGVIIAVAVVVVGSGVYLVAQKEK